MKRLFLKFAAVFFSALVLWWWTGPSSNETTVYSATCVGGTKILPPRLVLDLNNFNETSKRYREDRATCQILPGVSRTYKLNAARAEVYYEILGVPKRLADCAILDNKNWRCAYPGKNEHVTIVNGLSAFEEGHEKYGFSIHRYQWWYVTWYWLVFSKPPRGEWLIPEQVLAF